MIYDVAIIGAGIVGTAIARELSKYNLSIALIEKDVDVSMGATKANSAIVHGGYAEKHNTLKGRLCYKGRMMYEELDKELNFGFRKTGSLVISFEDDLKPLLALMANGVMNGCHDLSILNREEILKIEPNINPNVKHALYCEGAGVCSPYEMAIALAENAITNGVKLFLNSRVLSIKKENSIFNIKTNNGDFSSRFVINAAGLYSDEVSSMAGEDYFKILPRSGEYLLFARDTGKVLNTVVFQMPTAYGKGVLATSTYHGNLLIGPDASDDSEKDDTSTHIERMNKILELAKETTDKIDINKFIRSFTGVRARSSTDDFIIEETSTKGFINVAGIQSPGLTSAPAIALMVKEILENAGCVLKKKDNFIAYRKPIITKKSLKPFKEIKDKIDIDSCPEKIICRCEQVTEGEIVDSLHRGINVTTIDGVKRRTRASMGWCQGTFCKSRIKEIIEREYNIKIDDKEDIEYSGVNRVGKSEILKQLGIQNNTDNNL